MLGAIVGAAIILGAVLVAAGLRRKGAKAISRHRKEAETASHDNNQLRDENLQLRRQLEERNSIDEEAGRTRQAGAPVTAPPRDPQV